MMFRASLNEQLEHRNERYLGKGETHRQVLGIGCEARNILVLREGP